MHRIHDCRKNQKRVFNIISVIKFLFPHKCRLWIFPYFLNWNLFICGLLFIGEKLILILDHEFSRSKSHEMCSKVGIITKSDVKIVLDYRHVSFHQLFNRKCSACGELLDCKTLLSFVSLELWCLDISKLCFFYWSISIVKIMLATATEFSSSAELFIENFLLALTQLIELRQFWCVRRILIPKKRTWYVKHFILILKHVSLPQPSVGSFTSLSQSKVYNLNLW